MSKTNVCFCFVYSHANDDGSRGRGIRSSSGTGSYWRFWGEQRCSAPSEDKVPGDVDLDRVGQRVDHLFEKKV